MKRLALRVEYDGSAYLGWERQRQGVAVQAVLEAALARIAGHCVATVCAGRTDSGVHGLGQVVHFDTRVDRPAQAWTLGVNTHLPADVSVSWAGEVFADFHARFAAQRRRYLQLELCVGSANAEGEGRVRQRQLRREGAGNIEEEGAEAEGFPMHMI